MKYFSVLSRATAIGPHGCNGGELVLPYDPCAIYSLNIMRKLSKGPPCSLYPISKFETAESTATACPLLPFEAAAAAAATEGIACKVLCERCDAVRWRCACVRNVRD